MKWKRSIEENCQSCEWRCRVEDNCERDRKDQQRITASVMDERTHRGQCGYVDELVEENCLEWCDVYAQRIREPITFP